MLGRDSGGLASAQVPMPYDQSNAQCGVLLEHNPRYEGVLIWGSIWCALAMKIGGEAKAHEISKTRKWFGQILTTLGDIKIINILMEFLSLISGKIKC